MPGIGGNCGSMPGIGGGGMPGIGGGVCQALEEGVIAVGTCQVLVEGVIAVRKASCSHVTGSGVPSNIFTPF